MKKQYINPTTEIISVEMQGHLMFASNNGDGTYNGGGSKGTFDENVGQLGRGGSDWDED